MDGLKKHMISTCDKANALIKEGKVNEASKLIREEAAKNPILQDVLVSIESRGKVLGAFSKGFK